MDEKAEAKARLRREIGFLLTKPVPSQAGSWSWNRSVAYKEAVSNADAVFGRSAASIEALQLALNRLSQFYDLAA